jgi:transposase InsO family protein
MPNSNLWHQRLGYIGETALNYLSKAVIELPKGLENNTQTFQTKECETCLKSKFKATISREASTKREYFLDLVTIDLCGPIPIGLGGYRYFLSLLEASSRWIESYPLRSQEEVYSKLKEYTRVIKNYSNRKIKILKSDNGTEFINKRVKELLTISGIEH